MMVFESVKNNPIVNDNINIDPFNLIVFEFINSANFRISAIIIILASMFGEEVNPIAW